METYHKNDEIFEFLLKETMILNPISEIIKNLEANNYWSKDIVFLEKQLKKYAILAVELLNINFKLNLSKNIIDRDMSEHFLNEHLRNKYLNYFKNLLELFKNQL